MGSLFDQLQAVSLPNVFNPWRDVDALDIHGEDAPAGRLERLRQHFTGHPTLLLVGEAPGYQGCRFTGVPFTSEALVCAGSIPRVPAIARLTTRPLPWSEPSARIVWKALYEHRVAESTVLWNTFPFHPHREGEPHSNRAPTAHEVDSQADILRAVVAQFPGVRVIAVGRIAEATLKRLHIGVVAALRHPSMGGAPAFRAGLGEFLAQAARSCASAPG